MENKSTDNKSTKVYIPVNYDELDLPVKEFWMPEEVSLEITACDSAPGSISLIISAS